MDENLNVIKIKKPRLLKIGQNKFNNNNNNKFAGTVLEENYKKENELIQQRIKNLNEMDKQLEKDEEQWEKDRMLKCFYKNPFCYLDYLVKKYFRDKGNLIENLQIKEEIIKNFNKFCSQIEGKIHSYTNNELFRLKQLEKKINDKLNDGNLNDNINNNDNNEFKSQPVNQKELYNAIFGNNGGSAGIFTKPDANNFILNDPYASYNQEFMFNQALQCLKDNKIEAPKMSYLTTNNLDSNYIKKNEMEDTNRLKKLKTKSNWNELKENPNEDNPLFKNPINQYDQKGKVKKSLNEIKKKEKKDFEKMIQNCEESINNMNNLNNENKNLIKYVQKNLNDKFNEDLVKLGITKLSIYETNLNQIKKDLDRVSPWEMIGNYKERKKIMEEEYTNTLKYVNNFLQGNKYLNDNKPLNDEQIEILYQKYKKNNKKKRPKSNKNFRIKKF